MLNCPNCGARTTVNETRSTANYIRRRRYCSKIECNTRFTTVEVTVKDMSRQLNHLSVVPTRDLELIRKIADGALAKALTAS